MSSWSPSKSSNKRRKFEDGIPPLEKRVTESGASIPSEADHKAVTFEEKPFGLLATESFDKIKGCDMSLHVRRGALRYASENDVATHVTNLLNSLLEALDLEDMVEVFTEVGIFNVRPGVWVLMIQGYPIGVVEVKKPDIKGKPPALNHPNVLGELNNFMLRLKTFYGITPVFGLLTIMVSWRVAWFSEDDADGAASEVESFNGPNDFKFSRSSQSALFVPPHRIDDDDDEEEAEKMEAEEPRHGDDETTASTKSAPPDHLHVSTIYDRTDSDHELLRAVASALLKMMRCQQTPMDLSDLSNRRFIKFEKGKVGTAVWSPLHLDSGVLWDSVAGKTKYLFALQDLGHGAHGRVWLTCTGGGRVCVLKFSLGSNPAASLDKEFDAWKKVYGSSGIKVYRELWNAHEALRMPHFASIDPVERVKALPLVKTTLTKQFDAAGVKHNDVEWRNIGLYTKADGSMHAVVFDMGSTSNLTGADSGWVDQALQHLGD